MPQLSQDADRRARLSARVHREPLISPGNALPRIPWPFIKQPWRNTLDNPAPDLSICIVTYQSKDLSERACAPSLKTPTGIFPDSCILRDYYHG